MTEPNKIQHIWNPKTGISDFEVPWESLAASETESIRKIWKEQRERLDGSLQLKEFIERLRREWAIETGIIENVYQIEFGVTQTLIERGFQAELLTHGSTDKPTSYVIKLLKDQEDALEGVFDFVSSKRILSTSYIKELHAALVQSQDTTDAQDTLGNLVQVPLQKGDWKLQPNYPTRNGILIAYCPPEQVASEMDRLVSMHLAHVASGVSAEVEAAWLHHRFSQIHPFQDGNGRVSRALASMVLIRAELFPLVVTRDDKTKYLDALEAADANDLKPLVSLFAALQRTQFRRATALSEDILAEGSGIRAALSGLEKFAERSHAGRTKDQQKVFQHAQALEVDTVEFLRNWVPEFQRTFYRISAGARVFVNQSTPENNHYFRSQILENAKEYLNYFADTLSYRSWVSVKFLWERSARLIFAFHGIGRPFSGSLVCAPFLEFRDNDEEEPVQVKVYGIANEPFVFFYDESIDYIMDRFRAWRERIVVVALKQISESF